MSRILVDSEMLSFQYCPGCGREKVLIDQPGDYLGEMHCLSCDWSLDYLLLDEYRSRYPEEFYKKFVADLDLNAMEDKMIQECYHEDVHGRLTKKKGGGGEKADMPMIGKEQMKDNRFTYRKNNPKKYNEWIKEKGE